MEDDEDAAAAVAECVSAARVAASAESLMLFVVRASTVSPAGPPIVSRDSRPDCDESSARRRTTTHTRAGCEHKERREWTHPRLLLACRSTHLCVGCGPLACWMLVLRAVGEWEVEARSKMNDSKEKACEQRTKEQRSSSQATSTRASRDVPGAVLHWSERDRIAGESLPAATLELGTEIQRKVRGATGVFAGDQFLRQIDHGWMPQSSPACTADVECLGRNDAGRVLTDRRCRVECVAPAVTESSIAARLVRLTCAAGISACSRSVQIRSMLRSDRSVRVTFGDRASDAPRRTAKRNRRGLLLLSRASKRAFGSPRSRLMPPSCLLVSASAAPCCECSPAFWRVAIALRVLGTT